MIIKNKKLILLSEAAISALVAGLVLALMLFIVQESKARYMGDDAPECFYNADCDVPYDYCTYGYGLSPCIEDADCLECGSSVGANYRCYNSTYCQVQIIGDWLPCGMCYDVQNPPPEPPPDQCNIIATDFNNALYIKSPNGTTQFAITDGGHLLAVNGNLSIVTGLFGYLDMYYDPNSNNNFPIYNGDTIIALFIADNDSGYSFLYLGGYFEDYEFEINLTPPAPGSFVIKNSADMVVAYIDPYGNLHLMGCVDDNGYSF